MVAIVNRPLAREESLGFLSSNLHFPCLVEFPSEDIIPSLIQEFQYFLDGYFQVSKSIRKEVWQIGRLDQKVTAEEKFIAEMDGCIEMQDRVLFHYRPRLVSKLQKTGIFPQQHGVFFDTLGELYHRCRVLVQEMDLVKCFQGRFPLITEPLRDALAWDEENGESLLRLAHYPKNSFPPKALGYGHVDNSFATVHIGDNRGRMLIIDDDNNREIKASLNQAIVFPGTQATALTGGGLSPTKHRFALQEEACQYDQWAIVFFLRVFSQPIYL